MREYLPLLGRGGIALIFVVQGLHKIMEFPEVMLELQGKSLPLAGLILVFVIIIELLGGIMIMLGYKTKFCASVMSVYLILVTCIFHPIWLDLSYFSDFVKNIAIIGALFTLAYHGSGPKSMDSHHLW